MQLDDLDFADDLALLSQTQQQMHKKTTSVATVSLNIHNGKSKIFRYNTARTNSITIDGEDLENVKTFTYLSSIIDEQGGSHADVKARIGKARAAYLQMRNIWNSKYLSTNTKVTILIQMSKQFYCMKRKPGELRKPSSRTYSNSKCFKCDDIGYIQSICNTNVHLIATNIKSCNSDSTESSIYNDGLSLSTIAIYSVESQSSSELNQIQNSCETTVSNQSIYQNSHAIVPGMALPNDSHISDEIYYKSEENMLNEPIHYQEPESVMIDANFSNDPLLCNDILNKFEETISEE
ncbi:unnamed protein product [Schistosoma margrebowiei]|uniref:Uncharacterized protein n=1 Tax=Schistosoma margrebowiei TaxID=48269 RepID=A0A183LU18_9TREM|nr:unnamed protein product [Schistosoma margrebowiei]